MSLSKAEERAVEFLRSRGYEGIVPLHTALLLEGKTIKNFECHDWCARHCFYPKGDVREKIRTELCNCICH